MIPLHLKISGFLSYRQPAELDFTGFDLACIAGANGAGKSSLLDAITWALFGQARRRDDALINLQSDAAEVIFTFRYEGAVYRILRSVRRGKSGSLELQVGRRADDSAEGDKPQEWKPLTERTQRETQSRIEDILRLDYETFINASFFLQGKADHFAQQTPARRKEVLGSILGMEVWEARKAQTAERRRASEVELAAVMTRISEVDAEMAEEPQRRERLGQLERELARLVAARKAQTSAVDAVHQSQALIEKQRTLLAEQTSALESVRLDVDQLRARLEDRQAALRETTELTRNAPKIEADYSAWRKSMADLEHWERVAHSFRDHDQKRLPLLQLIAAERARLEQEQIQLESRRSLIEESRPLMDSLAQELKQAETALTLADARMNERADLQAQVAAAREQLAGKTAENKHLKEQMDDLKRRIDALDSSSGTTCPLCGQELTDKHRRSTVKQLQAEGRALGDGYRANTSAMQALRDAAELLQRRFAEHTGSDDERVAPSRAVAALTERLNALHASIQDWETNGKIRMAQVQASLTAQDFAASAQRELGALDAELANLGYDAAAHDAIRREAGGLRSAEQAHARLQAARGALGPLENEIHSLESQIRQRTQSLEQQAVQVNAARQAIDALAATAPDSAAAEQQLFELQEQENRLNQEVGAARQKVVVLDGLLTKSGELQALRHALALNIGRHRALETAFGKDGVPALLIEQALPEMEAHANDILDRLSDGRMSVHFETQSAYRDRKRDDLRETLEIKISDGAGQRAYEMYSGGEAFRVDFAIRLALSQILAGRTGARLQTLVIDEGFGSQDAQGIQRLIETINVIRHDFAKILVISHLEGLKDAFPTRIEVEKTGQGSVLTVY